MKILIYGTETSLSLYHGLLVSDMRERGYDIIFYDPEVKKESDLLMLVSEESSELTAEMIDYLLNQRSEKDSIKDVLEIKIETIKKDYPIPDPRIKTKPSGHEIRSRERYMRNQYKKR